MRLSGHEPQMYTVGNTKRKKKKSEIDKQDFGDCYHLCKQQSTRLLHTWGQTTERNEKYEGYQ